MDAHRHKHTHKVTVKYLLITQVSNFHRFLCLMRQHASVAPFFFFVFLVSSLNRVGEKHSAHSAKLLIQAYSMQRQFP